MSITRQCSIENCKNKYHGKGYCNNHYQKYRIIPESLKCSVKGCNGKYKAKLYCYHHYSLIIKKPKVTPEYKAWENMKIRCYIDSHECSHRYKKRGIEVCDDWVSNFDSFLKYVGKRPTPKHSLDRINNDGNYEPGNVKWSTRHEQMTNTSKINKIGYRNITKVINKKSISYRVSIQIDKKINYIGTYNNIEEAILNRNKFESKL